MARARSTKQAWPRTNLVRGLVLLLGISLFVAAVVLLAQFTRQNIRNWDRYTASFADIACPSPPAEDRDEFLAEVQYLAGMPDGLQVLDESLPAHLAAAFASHPWVERVEQVLITPPHQVEARLSFRTPVLEVVPANARSSHVASPPEKGDAAATTAARETAWLVDGEGILLPRRHFRDDLPLLVSPRQPTAAAGQRWTDPGVEAAARTALYLRGEQTRLRLQRFEHTKQGLVLSTPAGSRVLWGSAPGQEKRQEAKAAEKLERLLRYCEDHGGLDQPTGKQEHDVRSASDTSPKR
jgi:hypothetical protein